MLLYGGIDLHANNSVIVLLNEQDEVLYQKRLPNELSTILEQLAPYYTALQGLAIESTYNWYWLVDGLMEVGYRVHLANPAAMQQYEGLKYTDDHSLGHITRRIYLSQGRAGGARCIAETHASRASTHSQCTQRAKHPGTQYGCAFQSQTDS
jgi:hypothetical protein